MSDPAHSPQRREEIARNLARVEDRVTASCRTSGRSREDVTLVAVTKTFPAADIGHLVALGVRELGENRDQDAVAKVAECARMGLSDLRWHFVGQVQTNKSRSIATYAHLVHSVDRERLVVSLDRAAEAAGRLLGCLVQVDLDERPERTAVLRGGVPPTQVLRLAGQIEVAEHLALRGLMAVAPLDVDPASAFERLAAVALEVQAEHPEATVLSAGMSGDLEAAVRCGATHLRVGTALLGSRPPLG